MNKSDFLFVYDLELKKRLRDSGEIYITRAKAVSTDKEFELYYKSDKAKYIADNYLIEKKGQK